MISLRKAGAATIFLCACAGKAAVDQGAKEQGGQSGSGDTAAPPGQCPTIPSVRYPASSTKVGTCSTVGALCTPPFSEVTCVGGSFFSTAWNCTCDGQAWKCDPTAASKGVCSPVVACKLHRAGSRAGHAAHKLRCLHASTVILPNHFLRAVRRWGRRTNHRLGMQLPKRALEL